MKTFAQAAIIFLTVVATAFLCFNLITGSITDNEAEAALSQSVEQALYVTLTSGETYSIDSNEDFVNDFLSNLLVQVNSPADIAVRILDVDYQEGLLDVEVTETMTYPDGKTREVTCRKTVLLDAEK